MSLILCFFELLAEVTTIAWAVQSHILLSQGSNGLLRIAVGYMHVFSQVSGTVLKYIFEDSKVFKSGPHMAHVCLLVVLHLPVKFQNNYVSPKLSYCAFSNIDQLTFYYRLVGVPGIAQAFAQSR